jgi:uncharacterized repeat protein (TIGR01451 family)
MGRVGNLRPLLRVALLIGIALTLAGGVGAAQAAFHFVPLTGNDNPISDALDASGDGSLQGDNGSGGDGDNGSGGDGENRSGGDGGEGENVSGGGGDNGCPPGETGSQTAGGDNGSNGDNGHGCDNGNGDNGDNGNGDNGCPPDEEKSGTHSAGGGDNGNGDHGNGDNGNGDNGCGDGDNGNGDGDNGNGDNGCPPDEESGAHSGGGGDNGDNGCGDGDNGCPPGNGDNGDHNGDNGNGDNGNGDNGNGDNGCGDGDNGDGDNGCPPGNGDNGDHNGDNGNGDNGNGHNGDGDNGNGDNGDGDNGCGDDDNGCPPGNGDNGDHNGDNGNGENGNGDNGNGEDCDQDKPGKLIVKKVVVNDDGGTATASDFSFQVNGGPAQSFESDGQNDLTVDPGTYTVTEPSVAGYTTSYDNCSGLVIKKGDSETCTITNDDMPPGQGRVIVKKVMSGGTDTFDFSGTPSGSISEDGGTISATVAAPGQYMSTEAPKEGWNLGSISCDDENSSGNIGLRRATFRVEAGETVTCTFRNRKRSEVIVKKVMIGGADTFEFTGTPAGTISASGATLSAEVSPGSYSSTEAPKAGWDLVSITCDDRNSTGDVATRTANFNTAPGEVVTCTFTNKKRVGSIIVKKKTDPAGHAQAFNFEASYDADGFSLSDGQSNDSGALSPGTYSVSENVPQGWELSAVCDDGSHPSKIELQADETVTCTFTNKLRRGSIIVEKQTNPAGADASFTFTGDAAGSIGDNGQIVVSNLLPGTYTSTEAALAGWILGSISCDDGNSSGNLGSGTATFRLEAGETVKCTFTNTKPVAVGQGAIDVQKSANPTSLKEPGGSVTYSVTITNVSPVMVTVENVVDDRFGDLDDTGGNGCFDVPINLTPMTSVNCTFQRTITGTAGSVHINTVTATGHDAFGNPVSDADDARVEITPRLIDLVIVKDASSPTPLNGIVNYTMTVTNKGPDTATNVQLADPAPAGIVYLTANPSQGTCTVTASLITCSLGTIAAGQTVTINATGRATTVGTHTNTATVTGGGGRETNPADNVDSATTVVPAPTKPPTPKPTPPKPQPEVCLTLTVTPKMIKADGKPDRISVKVTAGKKRTKGVKVVVRGAGVEKTARSNGKGLAVLLINPKKPGLITITARETKQRICGPKRIGVVGVFRPPLTG